MSVTAALLLVLLVPVASFAPGFLLVRRRRGWSPAETLAVSVAASIVFVYVSAFAIFAAGLPWASAWLVTALSAGALVVARQDVRRLFAAPLVRRIARQFAALYLWNLLLLAILRHYGGGWWGPDWYEHYERTLFFLDRGPADAEFLGRYLLPARPPLMNLFAAFVLAQAGPQFANFQLTFAFLNLLPFVPMVLLSSLLVRRGSGRSGLLALVLACNPMFLHNAEFAWTKALPGFFVALGLWCYVTGWRRRDTTRMTLAFASLTAGTLAHYSGAPYALVVGLHYLIWLWWRRPHPWREPLAIVLPSAALLATWFGYAIRTYGLDTTIASTTTVSDAARLTPAENLAKVGLNVIDTLVPHLARGLWVDRDDAPLRQLADNAFCVFQVNLPFLFGLGGFLVMLFLLARTLAVRVTGQAAAERAFWLAFAGLTIVLGVAVHGERDHWGLAHIGLQPIAHVGLAWLAASLPTVPRGLRLAFVLGSVVDVVLGVALRVNLESRLNGWAVDYNLEVKETANLVFLGDWWPALTGPLQAVMWVVAAVLIARLYRRLATPLSGAPGAV